MNLVSICIPCHNAVHYVSAALDSLLTQTWENLEIIVVNDGSTDGSEEVLSHYEKRGVKVIHEKCGSAAKARNRAWREANGDYIKFFDADDLLSPEMLEKQMSRLNGIQDSVASSEWGRFYNDDTKTYRPNPESVWRDMKATDWLVEACKEARPMMQPGMFLIPRKIIETAGAWDETLSLIDDFEFFTRILCHSTAVLFTPGATLYYRSGVNGSLSQQKSRMAVESAYHSLMQGTKHLLALHDDANARQSCANLLQDFIYTYYPAYPDLYRAVERRVAELGGGNLPPDGPPRFHQLRKIFGWRVARRIQRFTGHQ